MNPQLKGRESEWKTGIMSQITTGGIHPFFPYKIICLCPRIKEFYKIFSRGKVTKVFHNKICQLNLSK